MGAERYKLVIIGSGFAAVALMIHLFRQDSAYAGALAVIGPAPLGGGGAYHTAHPDFRLNVRAELMRLHEDEEQNFARWADSNLSDPQAATPQGQFFRRRDFHRYLLAEYERMNVSDKSIHIDDMAVSVTPPASQPEGVWQIGCRSGRTFWAEKIVLATGNPPPRWPCKTDAGLSFHSGLVEQPWQGEWCQSVSADDTVCLVGGGLTAMDSLHCLERQGHRGDIYLVSPVGMLPPVQTGWTAQPAAQWPEPPLRPSQFLSFMRSHLAQARSTTSEMSEPDGSEAEWAHTAWQEQFESLRIGVNRHWRALSPAHKRQLMRHLGGMWMLARFRSAPQTMASAEILKDTGQLSILTDRVTCLSAQKDRIEVTLSSAGSLVADHVINCSGSAADRLCHYLISEGHVKPCAFGIGVEVDDALRVKNSHGHIYSDLFALGAMIRTSYGDVVGAGTIATQARGLAAHLSSIARSDTSG